VDTDRLKRKKDSHLKTLHIKFCFSKDKIVDLKKCTIQSSSTRNWYETKILKEYSSLYSKLHCSWIIRAIKNYETRNCYTSEANRYQENISLCIHIDIQK